MRYELENIDSLLLHLDVYQIFLASWISYFKKLQGFNEAEVLEFSQNLTEGHSLVHEVRILVTKETLAIVSGLVTTGERWFTKKSHLPDADKGFLMDDEKFHTKGRGTDASSLPEPWGNVT